MLYHLSYGHLSYGQHVCIKQSPNAQKCLANSRPQQLLLTHGVHIHCDLFHTYKVKLCRLVFRPGYLPSRPSNEKNEALTFRLPCCSLHQSMQQLISYWSCSAFVSFCGCAVFQSDVRYRCKAEEKIGRASCRERV